MREWLLSCLKGSVLRWALAVLSVGAVETSIGWMCLADQMKPTLRIGVRVDAPPFSERAANDTERSLLAGYRGFSVEICRRIAERFLSDNPGSSVEDVPITAETRFREMSKYWRLKESPTSFLCDPTSVRVDRMEFCDFSFPYFATGISFLSREAIGDFDDLENRVIGVVNGTSTQSVLLRTWRDRFRHDPSIRVFDDYSSGAEATEKGNVDALFGDLAIIESLVQSSNQSLIVSDEVLSLELYAFCVRPGDRGTMHLINSSLISLYSSGEIYSLAGRSFGGKGVSKMVSFLYTLYSSDIDD